MSEGVDKDYAGWARSVAEGGDWRDRLVADIAASDNAEALAAAIQADDDAYRTGRSTTIEFRTHGGGDFAAFIEWREPFDPELGARMRFRVEGYGNSLLNALKDAADSYVFHRGRIVASGV